MTSAFKEIINMNAPKLKTPHFVIDHEVKDVEKPFPSVASYIIYVGKSRSGKSSLITSLLTYRYVWGAVMGNIGVTAALSRQYGGHASSTGNTPSSSTLQAFVDTV